MTSFSYEMQAATAIFQGEGGVNVDVSHMTWTRTATASLHENDDHDSGTRMCDGYRLDVYPPHREQYTTPSTYQEHDNDQLLVYAIVILVLFALTIVVFAIFENLSQRQENDLLLLGARRSNAILLTTIVPKQVRDRILKDSEAHVLAEKQAAKAEKKNRASVTNGPMATDIADKELKNLRNASCKEAFSQENSAANSSKGEGSEDHEENVHRKANIVVRANRPGCCTGLIESLSDKTTHRCFLACLSRYLD